MSTSTVTPPKALEARGLTRQFQDRDILSKIDLVVPLGQIVALTGANGSGKTSLLHCLAGRLRVAEGQVLWFGLSPHRRPELRRHVGLAAHESHLYLELTARENLLFAARMHDVTNPVRRVSELLAAAHLESWADLATAELSKGLRQRVSVARALVHDPGIVLLDEPWNSLDAESSRRLDDWLLELRCTGHAICLSSHNVGHCHELADRVCELRDGRLTHVTSPGHCNTPFTRAVA